MSVPLVSLLVLAVMGISSAVGVASPRTTTTAQAPNNVVAMQGGGLAAAVKPLSELRNARMLMADPQGSAQPSVEASAHSQARSVIRTTAGVAQAIAPQPSAVINPMVAPAPTALAVAAAAVGSVRAQPRGTITIETFGYSFGAAPDGCAFVADVRNIDAGTFVQTETGLMPSVRDRVMATSAAQAWLATMRTQWMPSLKDGDRVAIGCARGHHRSVTLGVIFAEDLRAQGYTVNLVHRDILRTW